MLTDGDLLRDQNPPWLSLTPDCEQGDGYDRLEKLAKRLTKEDENAAALLFFLFDYESFRCRPILHVWRLDPAYLWQ